ncbi:MAG TPA: carboxypeptidase-like regulatory domain-containing protein, partial [Thermoanaerobaculia bacterium]|nr:carboxypeptidase-like regulatory domain-containing protein [Thermoanaerobaculia bacterium]
MNTLRRTLPVLLSFLLTFSSFPMAADPVTATLEGIVTDTSGQPLPGVSIEVKSPSLVGVHIVVTDGQGRFKFPPLPIGMYSLRAALSGFDKVEQNILLEEKGVVLALKMSIGAMSGDVIVTAKAETISETAQMSTTASPSLQEKLPSARPIERSSSGAWKFYDTTGQKSVGHSAALTPKNKFLVKPSIYATSDANSASTAAPTFSPLPILNS